MVNSLLWNMKMELLATEDNGKQPIMFDDLYGKYFKLPALINRNYAEAVDLMRKYTRSFFGIFPKRYQLIVVPVLDEANWKLPVIGMKLHDGSDEDTLLLKLTLARREWCVVDSTKILNKAIKVGLATHMLHDAVEHRKLLVSKLQGDEE